MPRKIIFMGAITAISAMLLPLFSFAALRDGAKQDRAGARQEIQDKRNQLRQDVRDKRNTLKQDLKNGRDGIRGMKDGGMATSALREAREKFMQEIKQKRRMVHEELKEKRTQFREFAKDRRETLKKKFGEAKSVRIEQFFNQMVEKFDHAIVRLKELSDRISKRLDEAASRGKDVAREREMLKNANDKINDAERALEDAKVKFTDAAKGKDFRMAFAKVRELVQAVSQTVKDAHRALVDVVRTLKGVGEGEHATSTPSGNASSTGQ